MFDYRVKAESWKLWMAFAYLRVLQFLGRAPPLEKVKSFMETEEKRYVILDNSMAVSYVTNKFAMLQ